MPDSRSGEPVEHPLPAPPPADGAEHGAGAPTAHSDAATPTTPRRGGARRWWVWVAGGVLSLLVLIEGIPWIITALTDRLHRRRLRERARDLCRAAGGRPGRARAGGRQQSRAQGRPARAARQGAVPGPGRHRPGRGGGGAGRSRRRAGRRCAGSEGLARSQRFNLATRRSRTSTTRSPSCVAESPRCNPRRRRSPEPEPTTIGSGRWSSKGPCRSRSSTPPPKPCRWRRRRLEKAQQDVYQIRAALGLPRQTRQRATTSPRFPPDLDQTFSAVKEAQGRLMQTAAQLGVVYSFDASPKQMLAEFYKRDPQGNIDRIFAQLLKDAPGGQAGRGQIGRGASQSRPGQAEPPLLRRGGGDRRRRDAPQRQSRATTSSPGKA